SNISHSRALPSRFDPKTSLRLLITVRYEVIEHVADPAKFCKSLAALTVSDGATMISTINRSMRSYATAIVAAEHILHWVCFSGSSCCCEFVVSILKQPSKCALALQAVGWCVGWFCYVLIFYGREHAPSPSLPRING
ncbi:unnamed protein product, partial [Ilex paraguariensis]